MSEAARGQADESPLLAPAAAPPSAPAATQAAASAPPLPAPSPQQPPHAYDSETATLHTDLLGDLVVPGATGREAALQALSQRAAVYASRARGDGTRRVYRSAWRSYVAWCQALGREPLAGDPELLAMYATHRADAGVAVSTLRVDLAAIRTAHLLAGVALDLRHPQLAMVVEGITRGRGTRPARQAAPAVPDVLRQLLAGCPPSGALGARDRAMLLLGFGAALRRSELVALRLGEVTPVPGRGLRLLVRRSKTDQHGQGQEVAVCANPAEPLLCPVVALDAWLAHRHRAIDLDWTGAIGTRSQRPLFCAVTKAGLPTGAMLSDKAVARLIKDTATRAGLDAERYSGHSLRAGLATAAGDAGAALPDLMRQTRHKSTQVALAYLRPLTCGATTSPNACSRRQKTSRTESCAATPLDVLLYVLRYVVAKKLTITVDAEVYDGLHSVIGRRRISRFLNDLARPHVIGQDLSSGYAAMAADEEREAEATAWSEGSIADVADEPLRHA